MGYPPIEVRIMKKKLKQRLDKMKARELKATHVPKGKHYTIKGTRNISTETKELHANVVAEKVKLREHPEMMVALKKAVKKEGGFRGGKSKGSNYAKAAYSK